MAESLRERLWTGLEEQQIAACLVSVRGELLVEKYREPRLAHEVGKINSCTKSVLSALIGIAMDQGVMPGPEALVSEFFPEMGQDEDLRKRAMTLRHLLTMSSGLDWTEFGGQQSFPTMIRTPNWVDFVLSRPLAHEPGERMEYNSGCSQLLAAALRKAAGRSVAEFAESELFGPMGIDSYEWERDPQGVHTGGFGLRLKPVDLLKFGLLHLQQGSWKGRQVIKASTVKEATSPSIPATGPHNGQYGWHWWVSSSPGSEGEAIHYYYALGFGGQYVIVIPAMETVVVLTADRFKRKRHQPVDLFREYVVPWLVSEA
ncbi:serine hydrolase [Gorillibacterium sp. CAU 1737]|uniref:serine hydrolase domain-containing protein n=1 Tax=Gorillibacterium sp. CAU 1737 TaxID=3140362 RepID=UPI003260EEA1